MSDKIREEAERRWSSTPIYGHRLGTLTIAEGNKLRRDTFAEGAAFALTALQSPGCVLAFCCAANPNFDLQDAFGKSAWLERSLHGIMAAIAQLEGESG